MFKIIYPYTLRAIKNINLFNIICSCFVFTLTNYYNNKNSFINMGNKTSNYLYITILKTTLTDTNTK